MAVLETIPLPIQPRPEGQNKLVIADFQKSYELANDASGSYAAVDFQLLAAAADKDRNWFVIVDVFKQTQDQDGIEMKLRYIGGNWLWSSAWPDDEEITFSGIQDTPTLSGGWPSVEVYNAVFGPLNPDDTSQVIFRSITENTNGKNLFSMIKGRILNYENIRTYENFLPNIIDYKMQNQVTMKEV